MVEPEDVFAFVGFIASVVCTVEMLSRLIDKLLGRWHD